MTMLNRKAVGKGGNPRGSAVQGGVKVRCWQGSKALGYSSEIRDHGEGTWGFSLDEPCKPKIPSAGCAISEAETMLQ